MVMVDSVEYLYRETIYAYDRRQMRWDLYDGDGTRDGLCVIAKG